MLWKGHFQKICSHIFCSWIGFTFPISSPHGVVIDETENFFGLLNLDFNYEAGAKM